jgi:hypothetical protein
VGLLPIVRSSRGRVSGGVGDNTGRGLYLIPNSSFHSFILASVPGRSKAFSPFPFTIYCAWSVQSSGLFDRGRIRCSCLQFFDQKSERCREKVRCKRTSQCQLNEQALIAEHDLQPRDWLALTDSGGCFTSMELGYFWKQGVAGRY